MRPARAVPAVLATVVAMLTLSTGAALAHGPEHAKAPHAAASHGKAPAKASHEKVTHPKKVKPLVTLTGIISATPTATVPVSAPSDTSTATIGQPSDTATSTIGQSSATATSTITVAVKGGARELHARTVVLTFDASSVVRRGDRRATVADLRPGDHVSARVRRMPDGSWLVLRLNASPGHRRG